MAVRYYGVHRPIGIGCCPTPDDNPIVEIKNFDERTRVDDLANLVWGYVEYEHELTEKQMDDYELQPAGKLPWYSVIVRTDAKTYESKARLGNVVLSIEKPQEEERRNEKTIVTRMWFASKEEAESVVSAV